MSTPLLSVLAGPNGSGKSTFAHAVLVPATALPLESRAEAIIERRSFMTETTLRHPSKLWLMEQALRAGYRVELHVMLIPEDIAVARVAYRVDAGGHAVPPDKVRQRYRRLWGLVADARAMAHRATFYDNSRSKPFRVVAVYERGHPVGATAWPAWTAPVLTA